MVTYRMLESVLSNPCPGNVKSLVQRSIKHQQLGHVHTLTKPMKKHQVNEMIDQWTGCQPRDEDMESDSTDTHATPPVPMSPKQAAIDIEQALIQLDGDRELFHDVLNVFLETIPALLGDLRSATAASDAHKLEEAAHSLKGAASNICAEPVRSNAQRLEEMGKQGDLRSADAVFSDLQKNLEALKNFAKCI